jgi:hypothetical protein
MGDNSTPATQDSGSSDAVQAETSALDSGSQDAAMQDSLAPEAEGNDAGTSDGAPASEAGCPQAWLTAPSADTSITVPADGGSVLLHVSASGTQNYTCEQIADGGYSWVFVGPEAQLFGCDSTLVGHHFASDGGAAAPEWQTLDGTYVVGHKMGSFMPDAGPPSVPWLLLQATSHGGTGTLSQVAYVQRLFTDGGVAPSTTCDNSSADGGQSKIPYIADYYFYGP